jgi:hypothetical protein
MLEWLNKVLGEKAGQLAVKIINGIAYLVLQFDEVFVIIAILGVFVMMSGNRKLGTRMTSLSILLYAVLRAVITKCN